MATKGEPKQRAPRAPRVVVREPLVTVSVGAGGLGLTCEGVPLSRAAEVATLLNAQLDAALAAQPSLRGQLDHVPGGAAVHVGDDGDWEGRTRRVGFTGR